MCEREGKRLLRPSGLRPGCSPGQGSTGHLEHSSGPPGPLPCGGKSEHPPAIPPTTWRGACRDPCSVTSTPLTLPRQDNDHPQRCQLSRLRATSRGSGDCCLKRGFPPKPFASSPVSEAQAPPMRPWCASAVKAGAAPRGPAAGTAFCRASSAQRRLGNLGPKLPR